MIAAVRGTLEGKTLDSALVTVSGVTFRVYAPLPTLGALTIGEIVHLHTYLLVREDALTLYGFASSDERALFEQMLAVGGVGPRIGLALLSTLTAAGLQEAVLTEDVNRLSIAPGVGKKLAARLVLELKPRFEKLAGALSFAGSGVGPASATSIRAQVVDALTGLGYNPQQAAAAARGLPDDTTASLEDQIMRALRNLAGD